MIQLTEPAKTEIITLPPNAPKPRRVVLDIAPYRPPLEGRRYKTRLDFNENTVGYAQLLPEGQTDTSLFTCYPEYQDFIDKLANFLNIPAECLLLTNGSDEALDVIPRTFIEPGEDRALTTKPGFHMIAHYLTLAQAQLDILPLTDDFEYPIDEITQQLKNNHYKIATFATPDNPTSASIPKETVFQWCDAFPETLFVMDEAYNAYRGYEASCLAEACTRPNLLVTQTFSKAWGLAGLRLGYIVGHPQQLEFIRRVRSPYSVNALAVENASKLLENPQQILLETQNAVHRKNALIERVQAEGYATKTGDTNFFLMKMGLQASNFARYAAERGVLVRDQSRQLKLKGFIRVSTGSEGENLQFLDTLKAFKKQTALVFDLDDTLVDTRESFDRVVAYLVNKHSEISLGMKELELLRAEGGFNDDWDAVKELLRRRNVEKPLDEIREEGRRLYFEVAPEKETLLLPEEDLKALAKQYRLFIFTGRMCDEYAAVWQSRLSPYFERVYCSDEIEGLKRKPSPCYLHHIKEAHGLENAWYIGNSVDDMRAAKAAGFYALGVLSNTSEAALREAGADEIISHSSALKEAFAC